MNLSIKELNELIYSLGITAHNGRFVNKDVNESLLERMYSELNAKIADEAIDEELEDFNVEDWVTQLASDGSHFVSNEEADEDFRSTSVSEDYDNHLNKLNQRGYITQTLLDYVDRMGAVSHGDLETYYKQLTGSNSFSHILINLRTPYKNRPTQRYVAKEGRKGSDAKYVIKVANPSNWVVVED
jgi:hypothetical protein